MMERVEQKQRNTTTDDNVVKRWSDLPSELLELIKKRLFYADQQNLREVCKSWSSIEEEIRLVLPPPLQQMPWLLVFDETDSGKLVDPKYKKTYQVDVKSMMKKIKISPVNRMPLLHEIKWDVDKMEIHESKYGWLLVSFTDQTLYSNFFQYRRTAFFLYSPFLDQDDNNNCIELPILSVDTIRMATFTSNPLDIEACTVVTLNTTSDSIIINTYRRGQSSWNKLIFKCDQFRLSDVRHWMCTDECIFYYVLRDVRVGTFDLAREEWHVFPPLPTTMRTTLQTILLCWELKQRAPVYIVKSGGGLFLISERNLSLENLQVSKWCCTDQYIYRLDLSSMIWKDLDSVGERVLFIGNGYRSILKSNGELKGMSNTIYNCSRYVLKYCTVHDYTVRNFDKGFPQRHDCDIHYGSISREGFVKVLIDPPHLHH